MWEKLMEKYCNENFQTGKYLHEENVKCVLQKIICTVKADN